MKAVWVLKCVLHMYARASFFAQVIWSVGSRLPCLCTFVMFSLLDCSWGFPCFSCTPCVGTQCATSPPQCYCRSCLCDSWGGVLIVWQLRGSKPMVRNAAWIPTARGIVLPIMGVTLLLSGTCISKFFTAIHFQKHTFSFRHVQVHLKLSGHCHGAQTCCLHKLSCVRTCAVYIICCVNCSAVSERGRHPS